MPDVPRVILLIETSHHYGRKLLQGIARYANVYGPWLFYREPPFYQNPGGWKKMQSCLTEWGAHGIIAREPQRYEYILHMGVPTIVSPNAILNFPAILTDHEMIGRLAADHLLDRGFSNFAFCGIPDVSWSKNREESFEQHIAEAGFKTHIYEPPKRQKMRAWGNEQPVLARWLKALPKPVGVMCCNDLRGQNVIDTCVISGVRVPEEVAVIGVDNDELICSLTNPPLSSVILNPENAGFQAAELLDRLMQGQTPASEIIHNKPAGVVTRQSSGSQAIQDPDVAKALHFIRTHAMKPIQVTDVANELSMSRRHLYRKFDKEMGRSIHDEIRGVRVDRLKRMLTETDLSISQIATEMGFSNITHVSRFLRQETQISPQAFRKLHGRPRDSL
ncbi:MAG: DNA-binding transcriptional regulator [Phycisphaerae bacterium]|nr:DNA-binding transcriptional regulator [Phycisphaerae bacterium]